MNYQQVAFKLERQFMNCHEVITEVSHYLRTPLTVMLSTVSLLEMIQTGKINRSSIFYFEKMLKATQDMQQNCSILLNSIDQLNQSKINHYSVGYSLTQLMAMCTKILILLKRISDVATQYETFGQSESDEYMLTVSELNQLATQITDLLNSEQFNQHLTLFANHLFIESQRLKIA